LVPDLADLAVLNNRVHDHLSSGLLDLPLREARILRTDGLWDQHRLRCLGIYRSRGSPRARTVLTAGTAQAGRLSLPALLYALARIRRAHSCCGSSTSTGSSWLDSWSRWASSATGSASGCSW